MVQPYRYPFFDEGQQALAGEIIKKSELKRSKLANARVTFENLVFEEIQQEVVLLLCEKNGTDEHLIEHIEVKDTEGLQTLDPHRLNLPTKHIDFHTDKWTYYFLDKEELEFLNKIQTAHMPHIGTYANVEVGITTGANKYFTVPQSVVDLYQLRQYARPMVGRSVQVSSLLFTHEDWQQNLRLGAKANLLVFPPHVKEEGSYGVKAYIESGEKQGIHEGYKTGIRDDWYVIPSIKLSEALFLRRNNLYPKFVLNEAGAYTTDTMHRVFIHEGVNQRAFVASYYNSLSFAFAELLGRNFGGGVLELMPSEVAGIYLPYAPENDEIFERLDQMLREKRAADAILDYTDDILLRQRMGFSDKEVQMSRSIWHKLMNRRLSRETLNTKEEKENTINIKVRQLNFLDLFEQYAFDCITENSMACEDMEIVYDTAHLAFDKNVLISLVKDDNVETFRNHSAKIYYTGHKFPASVELNHLYYFMPYIKRKGIRDLYLIRVARVGTRKEGQPDNDPTDFRLVFEIEFVKQLFEDYKPIKLKIWRTFTDTNLRAVLAM